MPEWADGLTPNAILQPDVLDVAHRAATAQSWEKQLKTRFPDPSAAHSLAVLWYWWAITDEEQRSQGQKLSSVIPVEQMWQKAIACWAMFLANREFWSDGASIDGAIAMQVSKAVIDRLNGRLQERGQKHKNASTEVAGRYHELELALDQEIRTAKLIGSAGIRTERGKVVCGVLMLEQVELLETVRRQVAAAVQRSPSSESLKKLQQALSPYSSISALIENNKPQAAIDAIDLKEKEELTRLAQSSWRKRGGKDGSADDDWRRAEHAFQEMPEGKELTALRALALHFLATQQSSLNRLEDALTSWERALQCKPKPELKSNILAAIVSSCQSASAALQQHQPGQAIALLERALRLYDDPKLTLLLAELLTNRGIGLMNDAQKKAGPDGKQNVAQVKADLKKGLADLEQEAYTTNSP
jgi:tetratricopeptide (TPR) repeat protein